MITFNADEVYEMAEQIERNGARFYRRASEPAKGQTRDVFLRLAEMEQDHEKRFAEMRAQLADADRRPAVGDPDNEAALYLQASVEGKVFASDPSERLTGGESVRDILDTAIDLEKDSIVFYQSMKEVVPGRAGRDRLDQIIKEEIGHIYTLTQQQEQLAS